MRDVAQNADRFEALFRAYSNDILGYAMRRVDNRETAADVMAEVFAVAWRKIDVVPDGEQARLWLFGVARNVVSNQNRGIRRRNNLAGHLASQIAGTDLEPEVTESSETGAVLKAMKDLREDERELLQLVIWDGLKPSQAAKVVGIPGTTARTKMHKARLKLRTALAGQGLERSGDSGHTYVGGAVPTRDDEGSGNER